MKSGTYQTGDSFTFDRLPSQQIFHRQGLPISCTVLLPNTRRLAARQALKGLPVGAFERVDKGAKPGIGVGGVQRAVIDRERHVAHRADLDAILPAGR